MTMKAMFTQLLKKSQIKITILIDPHPPHNSQKSQAWYETRLTHWTCAWMDGSEESEESLINKLEQQPPVSRVIN